jgi:hypothetical protein
MWIRFARRLVDVPDSLATLPDCFLPPTAPAQTRAGSSGLDISIDPDQFYIGRARGCERDRGSGSGSDPMRRSDFCDNTTLFGLNGEICLFPVVRSREWAPYFGAADPPLVIGTVKDDPRDGLRCGAGALTSSVGIPAERKGLIGGS